MANPVTTPNPIAQEEVGTSPTLVYTSPAGNKAVPRAVDVCNFTAPATRKLTVWFVPAGQSVVSPINKYLSAFELPVVYNASKGLVVLDPGDSIVAQGDMLGLVMSVFGSTVTGA